MIIKKGQNSVLVLATLGVYLSLLMVGGTAPHVFAHSATTRNFEISEEIEYRDEFDNDPNEVKSAGAENAAGADLAVFAAAYCKAVIADRAAADASGGQIAADRFGVLLGSSFIHIGSAGSHEISLNRRSADGLLDFSAAFTPIPDATVSPTVQISDQAINDYRPDVAVFNSGHLRIVIRLPRAGIDPLSA